MQTKFLNQVVQSQTRKKCTKCDIEKSLNDFHKRAASDDGHTFACKSCRNDLQKGWRDRNFKHRQVYFQKYYEKNKGKYKEYAKEYYQNNKEKFREYNKQWHLLRKNRDAE